MTEGLFKFLKAGKRESVKALQRNLSPEVKKVLEYYKYYFTKFAKSLDRDYIKQALAVKEQQSVHGRCQQILQEQLQACAALQKIELVKQQILGKKAKPRYFKIAFQTLLFKQAQTKADRKKLISLFNFSPRAHKNTMNDTQLSQLKNTISLLKQKHAKKIEDLAREILI